ncbi:hypothetical protein E2P81_ATG07009 [Venturia nashicola]|uniref:Glyoxalase-like domain-containing protein n=1 Tax=Venturia nashicola TaxID=86259 RepID=A0A4Z1NYX9_9PEZI|nr:hypothetical protein E6O75_ATG07174 [Venturia nashicola]TLD19392.1 hypothetical protein E2P81_ATG07009 [Venturia nashicola]
MPFIAPLDHIVILIPQTTLTTLPPSLTSAFTIYPGGTHADGKTVNSLVLLESGVYLEFIAFVDDDPANKEGHWWGKKTPGSIIDFALTSDSAEEVETVRKALLTVQIGELVVGYEQSKNGGRRRPDGTSVEWTVTFPSPSVERGTVPFWCHDITPRQLRVPVQSAKEATQHPSRTVGVSKLIMVVSPGSFVDLGKIYAEILGREGVQGEGGMEFVVEQPLPNQIPSKLILRQASSAEEKAMVATNGGMVGIWEIVLAIRGSLPDSISEKIGHGTIRISFEAIRE